MSSRAWVQTGVAIDDDRMARNGHVDAQAKQIPLVAPVLRLLDDDVATRDAVVKLLQVRRLPPNARFDGVGRGDALEGDLQGKLHGIPWCWRHGDD